MTRPTDSPPVAPPTASETAYYEARYPYRGEAARVVAYRYYGTGAGVVEIPVAEAPTYAAAAELADWLNQANTRPVRGRQLA